MAVHAIRKNNDWVQPGDCLGQFESVLADYILIIIMKIQISALIISAFIFSCNSEKNKTPESAEKKPIPPVVIKTATPLIPFAPVNISLRNIINFPRINRQWKLKRQLLSHPWPE